MTYRNGQTSTSQVAVDTITGLLLGTVIGPIVGAAVAASTAILYLLSWLTIVGIPLGYMILAAGIPHGFWAAWAACSAGALVGGYRSSRFSIESQASWDRLAGMMTGIPLAMLIMVVRIAQIHDPNWHKPLPYTLALIVALIAGAIGGATGASLSSALNRRRNSS